MDGLPDNETRYDLVLYDDPRTPYEFVVRILGQVLALPQYDAELAAHRIGRAGRWALGPFPESVARAMLTEIDELAERAGHPLRAAVRDFAQPDASGPPTCAFCERTDAQSEHLFPGRRAYICDRCVISRAAQLHDLLPSAGLRNTGELLNWHFGDVSPDKFVKVGRTYPGRVRADLQTAIEVLFSERAIRSVGIKENYGHEQIDLTALWQTGRGAHAISAISFEEIDIGEAVPRRCQINGLWLLSNGDHRYAAVLSRERDYSGSFTIYLELSGPEGERTADVAREVFDSVEAHIRDAASYRGKVLSLEQAPHYGGSSTGITVHRVESVRREDVILPAHTLADIDRSIVRFCAQRDSLRALGQRTKRGVLFFGPPGTGKTHTIRYLASSLPNHTTFLVTAEQVGLLPEYFALARLLQPVIFVIEDADLLAKSRDHMHSAGEEVLLNQLLNEMDGLREDAEILFVLSTNKPSTLEDALVSRPGRIDQLIEFPLPDAECRDRLTALYGADLSISDAVRSDLITRTEGSSAAFIKELMRRLAQNSIERGDAGQINDGDAKAALEEMLFQRSMLNRDILGVG